MNKTNSHERGVMFLLSILFIPALFFPILSGSLLLSLTPVISSKNILKTGLFLIVIGFTLINLNKVITSDLYWYSQQYSLNYGGSISDIFSSTRAGVRARISEPIYHIGSYLLSNLTQANYKAYVIVVTFLCYSLSLSSINKILLFFEIKKVNVAAVLTFCIFFCIIFTQSLHLIRQYLSCAIFLSSIIYLLQRRIFFSLFLSLLACLSHNSVIVVSLLVYIIYTIHLLHLSRALKLFLCSTAAACLAAIYIFYFIYIGQANRLQIDDGSINIIFKMFDLSLLLFSFVIFIVHEKKMKKIELLYFIYFSFCVFLIFSHASFFLSLRYYFYLDFLRWIPLVIFFKAHSLSSSTMYCVNSFLIITGLIYFSIRIGMSPFNYGHTVLEYLFYPSTTYFSM